MEPKIITPGTAPGEPMSLDEYSEAFLYLYDEWTAADTYLEKLGYPAQVEQGGVTKTLTLTQRIRMVLDDRTD